MMQLRTRIHTPQSKEISKMTTMPNATLQSSTRQEWLAAFAAWFHGGALLMERGRDVDFFTEEEQELSDCSLDTASYLVVYNSGTYAERLM
jgi:hypothetical protein